MAQVGFSRYFPKKYPTKETLFQERILTGLLKDGVEIPQKYLDKNEFLKPELIGYVEPKIHTARKIGAKKRKPGDLIHFTVNARTEDSFQFAPPVKIKAVGIFEIIRRPIKQGTTEFDLLLNGKALGMACVNGGKVTRIDSKVLDFVKNDGFTKPEIFFTWFSESGVYELICWTDHDYFAEPSEFEKAIDESIKSKEDGKEG